MSLIPIERRRPETDPSPELNPDPIPDPSSAPIKLAFCTFWILLGAGLRSGLNRDRGSCSPRRGDALSGGAGDRGRLTRVGIKCRGAGRGGAEVARGSVPRCQRLLERGAAARGGLLPCCLALRRCAAMLDFRKQPGEFNGADKQLADSFLSAAAPPPPPRSPHRPAAPAGPHQRDHNSGARGRALACFAARRLSAAHSCLHSRRTARSRPLRAPSTTSRPRRRLFGGGSARKQRS